MLDISGVILAGGQSRRLGINKALLQLGLKTLIARAVENLSRVFQEVLVIANHSFPDLPPEVRIIPDIIPGMGSLGGLYTGLKNSPSSYIFALACDMPFLNLELIRAMAEEAPQWDVIIPKEDHAYQPLHAIYSINCLPFIEKQMAQGLLTIVKFFPLVQIKVIQGERLRKFNSNGLTFFNVNTRNDWEKARLIVAQRGEEQF